MRFNEFNTNLPTVGDILEIELDDELVEAVVVSITEDHIICETNNDTAHSLMEARWGRSTYYNPLDQERREQDYMDQSKRDFKRREHEAEWEIEKRYADQRAALDAGTWYIRIDGKVYKQKGMPKAFSGKKAANAYALAILRNKPELQGKVLLTTRPEDQPGVQEDATKMTKLSPADYNAKSKAIQDLQMDPSSSKSPEMRKELMRSKLELDQLAKRAGIARESIAEKLDPAKRARLDDLIDQYRDATDPNDYYDRDYQEPEDVIDMIRAEFGDQIAGQVEAGAGKMHYPRDNHTHGYDPLSWKKPVDRITKAGKMYKQDSDYRKNTIKSRYKLSGRSSTSEGYLDNPGEEDSPVAQAIIRRIMLQRTDLLAKHGPEKVGQAVDEVADFVGDVEEIGSSDVSGWVRHVEQILGNMNEAEYQGRDVPLGKPMQGDVKKFKVYVKDPSTGNVKKVNFGDKTMRIKKSNPARRRSFRARHRCENPGPKTKARYWSCRKW